MPLKTPPLLLLVCGKFMVPVAYKVFENIIFFSSIKGHKLSQNMP